ncbi:MAG: tetratricopeptide repeat protein [Pirellulaceae bacterium]|nr:tetratricopeptide repeat protein [Pirellulaceae bacterium]
MLAEDKLREGKLDEALAELQNAVRGDPSNPKLRVFLFQLLSVLGDWNRALNQLNVAGEMDASTLAMVQMYREALNCEGLRAAVFAGQRSPLVFGEPEQWIALLMESLRLAGQGQFAASADLRDQAFEQAPTTAGSLRAESTGDEPQAFEWIADADTRLGPMLEAIINGRYYWVPFHRIRRIDLEKPVDLRDMVWMPVHFTWINGGDIVGVIPVRYVGSEASANPLVRLARRTEWVEHDGGVVTGLGQRMLATDAGEFSLLDLREIVFGEA